MNFQWDGLYNPIFAWRCSTRDPAVIYHEGKFYIYVTIQFNQERWGAPEGYQIHLIETEDFRNFTNPRPITPTGYVSPGNIIRANGRFYMSITRYPWPTAVAMIESDDLVHWSEPRIVIPTMHGDYWGNEAHGPIDGYLAEWRGRYWMLFTDFQKGTRSQHLGLAVSDDLVSFENLTPDKPLLDSDFYNEKRGIENASLAVDGDDLYLFCSVGMPEQKIAMLKSRDIMFWDKLDQSAEIGGLRQEWSKFVACAQFVADWRELTGYWVMLYMGTRHPDPCDRMMLGMARSRDLKRWEVLPEGVSEEVYQRYCEAFRQRYRNGELR